MTDHVPPKRVEALANSAEIIVEDEDELEPDPDDDY